MASSNDKGVDPINWKALCYLLVAAYLVNSYMTFHIFGTNDKSPYCNTEHGELVLGYHMLHHNLGKEAQLKFLQWIRQATFRGSKGDIERLLTKIHQTSSKRQKELEDLYKLEPVIDVSQRPRSKLGESLQTIAENKGTKELALPNMEKTWKVRFYYLQSQATRMVAAIAEGTYAIETNPQRIEFLKQLAKEYEALREELIDAIQNANCDM